MQPENGSNDGSSDEQASTHPRTPAWRSPRLLVATGLIALLIGVGAYLGITRLDGEPSFDDPETAACDAPPVTFGDARTVSDHEEVEVHFTCEGADLAGTLYLPDDGAGSYPAVVWVHGAGESARLTYGGDLLPALAHSGIAVLSYDKRGVGESGGDCCPGDYGHFNLLTADVVGAVAALNERAEIDPGRIGLIGASQAGWIVPRAAVIAPNIAFIALVDAPTTTYGQTNLYERLAGDDRSGSELATRLADAGSSGFDPLPYLEQLTIPSLWLYGGQDTHVPTTECVTILDTLKQTEAKDISVVVYADAEHGLLDVPPTDPQALPTFVAWIVDHTGATN